MSDTLQKEFYLCPVTGMPFGDDINIEDIKNEELEKNISNYQFKGIKYSKEVQEQIDKGLLALVVVENKIPEDNIEETDGVKFSKLDMASAKRTGDYAFITQELFIKMFGTKSPEEMQYITEDVFKGLVNLKKIQEEELTSKNDLNTI